VSASGSAITPSPAGLAPGTPAQVPSVIAHVAAICRSKQARGVTVDVQAPAPGRYQVTICKDRKELVLTFTWRRRRWDLADVHLTDDGKPQDAARSMYEIVRLLSDRETGTEDRSRIRGSRLPRNSALDTKKNTVLRV
jgi:hypothetical protein